MWFEFLHQKLINKKRDFECTLLVIVNIFHIIVIVFQLSPFLSNLHVISCNKVELCLNVKVERANS